MPDSVNVFEEIMAELWSAFKVEPDHIWLGTRFGVVFMTAKGVRLVNDEGGLLDWITDPAILRAIRDEYLNPVSVP